MYMDEDVARVAHEAVRALQVVQKDPVPAPAWDDAEAWQRDATIESVQSALGGRTPRQEHDRWAAAKVRDGWAYGEVKDAAAKTHPCLVDYDDLPEGQKDKDRVLLAIVKALDI